MGLLFYWLFSLSLFMFTIQPWSVDIGPIPIQVIAIWCLWIWAIVLKRKNFVFAAFSKLQWSMITLIGLSIIIRSTIDGLGLNNIIIFGRYITGVMIGMIATVLFVNETARKIILNILAVALSLSCLVAILQYLDLHPALWQRTMFKNRGYIYGSTGLEFSTWSFGYSILGIGTFIINSLILKWRLKVNLRLINSVVMQLAGILCIIGLLVSKSRSSIFGTIVGCLTLLWLTRSTVIKRNTFVAKKAIISKGSRVVRTFFIHYGIVIFVVSLFVYSITVREDSFFKDERLWITYRSYINVILTNPIGIPHEENLIGAIDEASGYKYGTLLITKSGVVIKPHNIFLTTSVYYGPLAGIAFIIMYFSGLLKGRRAYLNNLSFGHEREACLSLLLFVANLSILSHSWFHNNSLVMGEMRNWLWYGFLCASANSIKKNHSF